MNDVAASPMDGELESVSLVDLAVTRLTREILSGRSDPGERLVKEQLTRRLGISRAPLREALRLLAQRGLVEHVPRRGVRVATLSERDVRELYELRDVLERFAVRAGIPVGRESDLVGLRAALDRMVEAATTAGRSPAGGPRHHHLRPGPGGRDNPIRVRRRRRNRAADPDLGTPARRLADRHRPRLRPGLLDEAFVDVPR
ncbi:GntR family transcriptional regulator [Micromonospora chokoriensis]